MASRYIQKYPIPQDFPSILKNFTRQILRDQPNNIIEYSAKYFQALEKGQTFQYKSAFNVAKSQKKYELNYDTRKAQQIKKKDLAINKIVKSDYEINQERIAEEIVEKIFEQYDKNQNGTLERKQIKNMLKDQFKSGVINRLPTDDEINDFVRYVDENGNGNIDRKQMIRFLLRAGDLE